MNDASIASTCLARHACRQNGLSCAPTCPLHIELRYQLALCGIPDEYRGLTVETLPDGREHIDDLRAFVSVAAERKPRNGLYLTSATAGNGKTESACAVAQSYIVARAKRAINEGRSIGQLVQFVNSTELLDLLRKGFDDDAAAAQASRLIERIANADLVVLDDLGAEKPTEWVAERFYAIINRIWANKTKQTLVVTSNRDLDGIELTLGNRIRSRIDGLTIVVPFVGPDMRRKKYGGVK